MGPSSIQCLTPGVKVVIPVSELLSSSRTGGEDSQLVILVLNTVSPYTLLLAPNA